MEKQFFSITLAVPSLLAFLEHVFLRILIHFSCLRVFMLKKNLREFDRVYFKSSHFFSLLPWTSLVFIQSRFTKWYLDFICVICHHKSSYDAFPNASLVEQNKRVHQVPQSIWCACLKKCWHRPNQNQRQRHSAAMATVKFNLPYI